MKRFKEFFDWADHPKRRWAVQVSIMVLVSALVALIVFLLTTMVTDAAPMEQGDDSPGIFNAEYTKLPDDSQATYRVDVGEAEGEAAEDESFMDSVRDLNPARGMVEDNAQGFMNVLVNLGLTWNMMMTNLMIGILNFGFQTEIVNSLADAMEDMVQNMAGVTEGRIGTGLYGTLIGFAVVATGLAVIFQLLVRRATLGSMQTIVQSVIAIGLALTLFANFGPLIKGMNEISTQISAAMLTGSTNVLSSDKRTSEELREDVSANLWDSFIGRPYMIMQYGTDNIEDIGEDRVNDLLAMPEGEERQEYVEKTEIADLGNENMTYKNVQDRAAFTLVYSIVNMVVSIPIFILAIALLVFQVWFLMMAFLSPFFLIQAAFPGQFGVLKRYAVELAYPLVCKIIVTIATFFIFSFGFIIYSMPEMFEVAGIPKYFISATFYLVLFLVLFFMRKRIASIMGAGNRGPFEALRTDIQGLKQSMDGAADKIGGIGKAAVMVTAGAVTGGPAGAAAAGLTQMRSQGDHAETAEPDHQRGGTAPMAQMNPDERMDEVDIANNSTPVASMQDTDSAVLAQHPEWQETTIPETETVVAPVVETPKRKRGPGRPRKKAAVAGTLVPVEETPDLPQAEIPEVAEHQAAPAPAPKRRSRKKVEPQPEPIPVPPVSEMSEPLASIESLSDAGDVGISRRAETETKKGEGGENV